MFRFSGLTSFGLLESGRPKVFPSLAAVFGMEGLGYQIGWECRDPTELLHMSGAESI